MVRGSNLVSGEGSLSIVITLVSGKDALRRCLAALRPQTDPAETEIIVPYDRWSADIAGLAPEFTAVRFHFIEDLGMAASATVSAHAHRLYDRRRAVGLGLAAGRIVAMTEDHAVPAADWCRQIRAAHQQPHAVIGGAIENAVDRPLNWALYYCDFGRYGLPRPAGTAPSISDVNVTYKRGALQSVRATWCDAYHEPVVHAALQARGEVMFFDPRIVVYQQRPAITLRQAFRERIDWGRVFAETRAAGWSTWRRLAYAAGTALLPGLLLARVLGHMARQRRTLAQVATGAPLTTVLLASWAIGELIGYVSRPPAREPSAISHQPPAEEKCSPS